MSGQRIGSINASVLATRTTKTHHQTFKIAFDILFDGGINQIKNTIEVIEHVGLVLQIILYCLIATMPRLKFIYPPRVKNAAAIEYETAAVVTVILWYSFAV